MDRQTASSIMKNALTAVNYPYSRAVNFAINPRHIGAFLALKPAEQKLFPEAVADLLKACRPLYFPDIKLWVETEAEFRDLEGRALRQKEAEEKARLKAIDDNLRRLEQLSPPTGKKFISRPNR